MNIENEAAAKQVRVNVLLYQRAKLQKRHEYTPQLATRQISLMLLVIRKLFRFRVTCHEDIQR